MENLLRQTASMIKPTKYLTLSQSIPSPTFRASIQVH
jgi:hypothetical protein